jgi:dTMP kinase
MTGVFIVFEGAVSAGKKTHVKLLEERLKSMGKEVVTISFPSYETEIGKIIRGWITRSLPLSPETASMLYAADRMQYQDRIKEWLKKDWVIITDRYCYSNIVYQSALGLSKQWLIDLERPIVKPDIVFLMDVPSEDITRGMRQESLQKFLNIEEQKPQESLKDRVRNGFLELANNPPYGEKWYVIDTTRPVEEVQVEILDIVQKRMS